MKIATIALAVFLFWPLPSPAQSQPFAFGFRVGSTKDEALAAAGGASKLIRSDGTTLYLKSSADPVANQRFSQFKLVLTPKLGLTSVTGITRIPSPASLSQIRRQYEAIRSSLVAEYGSPRPRV